MMKFIRIPILAVAIAFCLWLGTGVMAPSASALTQIKLSDLSYHECAADLAEGAVTPDGSAMPAHCFMITGKAFNPTNKPVLNADVFGRIYDANNNPVMQNRTRVGAIEEIPPGTSTFEFRISVSANQPTPLLLEQFKASGFVGKVRR